MKLREQARTHPLYVTSSGDGPWHVDVALLSSPSSFVRANPERLCALHNADYETRTDALPTMIFKTSIAGVVDFEHDPSTFALVRIVLPYTTLEAYGERTIVGVLEEVRLYPAGVDPLTQDDADTSHGMCNPVTFGYPGHEPHPFAPYQPPESDALEALVGRMVLVELTPQSLVDSREDDDDE